MEEEGFRVPAHINFPNNTPAVKCLIFIDVKNWNRISDLMYHIKALFDIDVDIWIYIDDMLLPKNESIKLIQRTDTIEVLLQQNLLYDREPALFLAKTLRSRPQNNATRIRENDHSSHHPSTSNGSRENVCIRINNGPSHSNATVVDSTCVIKQEEFTDIIAENPDGSVDQPKRKRRRKHKKPAKNDGSDDNVSHSSTLMEEGSVPPTPPICDSKKHIRFPENENPEAEANQLASPEETEKLRADLMALVTKLKNEKTFTRKSLDMPSTSTAPMEGIIDTPNPRDCHTPRTSRSSSTLETPTVGETISFTKIKLGEDYTPQMSGEIIGKILSVHNLSDKPTRVTMEIYRGSEEFIIPEGKFSLEDGDGEISTTQRVELHWHEVIKPRLASSY